MTPSPSPNETRLCKRPGKLWLKDAFLCLRKGVFLYSQSLQNKFTPEWCKNLRQLHKNND